MEIILVANNKFRKLSPVYLLPAPKPVKWPFTFVCYRIDLFLSFSFSDIIINYHFIVSEFPLRESNFSFLSMIHLLNV